VTALKQLEPRSQAALALGTFLLVADLLVLVVTGEFNVALGGFGVSIFGLAFTLPRNGKRNGSGDT
jgi:hypothetical protein